MLSAIPSTIFMLKYFALCAGFFTFIMCIMIIAKKNYKIVTFLAILMALAFGTYC